jgi:hypothetical protein
MAKATKRTELVKFPVTTYREESKDVGVTLELSMAEARALKRVLGTIKGNPLGTVREYTSGIWLALEIVESPYGVEPWEDAPAARAFPGGRDPYK